MANNKKSLTVREEPAKESKATKATKAAAAATKAEEAPKLGFLERFRKPREPRRSTGRIPDLILCGLLLLAFVSNLIPMPEGQGLLLRWFVDFFCGLFGRKLYFISMLCLPYLFWILCTAKVEDLRKRSLSMVGLMFIVGCLVHLILSPKLVTTGFLPVAKELYALGILGRSGGLFCGALVNLFVKYVGWFFPMMLLLILGAVCLIWAAGYQIVPILRHIRAWIVLKMDDNRSAKAATAVHPEPTFTDTTEEPKSGVGERFLNGFANWRAGRKLLKAADPEVEEEGQKKNWKARTKELVNQIAPEFLPQMEESEEFEEYVGEEAPAAPADNEEPDLIGISSTPVSVNPTAPEVRAEVAADPGVAVVPMQKQKVTAKDTAISAALVEQEIAAAKAVEKPVYCFPPIDLLQRPRGRAADGTAEMRENTRRLNETLASFKIEAHISNVTRGPSVTRYEVELEKGVRLNKLTSSADDIALSLGASGVRIAPVPGKISVVGIEVPNQTVTNVSLREVIDSQEFDTAKSHSSIAVGKDIGGSCIIGNIAKFPHMLIAGTTGSGKSVCMNSIIISLLYKASPEDVKLIMVDPKMVELGIYNGIPHLLIPVVTDPKKAAGSLQWAVTEMMRRYRSMSDAGVRDLESYNSMIEGGEIEGEKLPQVVVIIDELADLMLVAAKEVEESICRIAQMGRAAGIHLIIATQRPSADVITGLMKANIPSRIAFAVASAMESRIILDTQGAEKLVGKGDMLYSPIGSGKPQRVQGCFVTDSEVEAVANYVKEHFSSTYDQSVMEDIERKAEQTGSKGAPATASDPDPTADELAHDEMLPEAVDVILETKQASVSLLQRRLKLGYARAARIVDEMEEMGIVGPFVGSKPRQILVTKEQWEQMKQGQTIVTQPSEPVPEDIDLPF